ncbi:ArsR/SmtB family transcription factor [Aminobacter aganoensis]|uniref:DNA-binding transcriptional ArsR family regulator n=2 Tax=Aminobacter TaxID=31988 RepID=A0A7X0CC35_9HYPH|nr:metalloregulator ArsR/SmtB family transcription factor [Aminobacter aganoensis]MBB6352348.1 DNA-binding transcriptional ArsR family regulator [Aminobacter aganoensis]
MAEGPQPVSDLLDRAGEASEFLKKLANPNRLMIACALVEGERSVRELEDGLGIRQPGLSQQLAELRDAGLIVGRKQSKSVFYRLADERVRAVVSLLYTLFCDPNGDGKLRQAAQAR